MTPGGATNCSYLLVIGVYKDTCSKHFFVELLGISTMYLVKLIHRLTARHGILVPGIEVRILVVQLCEISVRVRSGIMVDMVSVV